MTTSFDTSLAREQQRRGQLTSEIEEKLRQLVPDFGLILGQLYTPLLEKINKIIQGEQTTYFQLDHSYLKEVGEKINTMLSEKNGLLKQHVVYRIAEELKTTKQMTIKGQDFKVGKSISELTIDELNTFLSYVSSEDIIARTRVLIAQYLHTYSFPSVTTKYAGNNIPLKEELDRLKNEVIRQLLPDLTDDEAKIILSNDRATAADVYCNPPLFPYK